MKKLLLTTSLWIVSVVLALALPVSEQAARQLALEFLNANTSSATRAGDALVRAETGIADGNDAAFYVFNTDRAFVMVSADDAMPSVLGYSEEGAFDVRKAPDALVALLRAYQDAYARSRVTTRASVPTHSDVATLIETQWGQDAPYNLNCPDDAESGVRCPTGCVATAMAQVMYYHQWPSTYQWNQMKLQYDADDTSSSAKGVAKLMADCGEAVYMSYAEEGSSAMTIMPSEALRYDFGYAETTDIADRNNYSATQWDALIYNEVSSRRPVIVGGQAASKDGESGHEFIVDGYRVKSGVGYYHVNWGWDGYSNNYFLLDVLSPQGQGTGGNAGSDGFNYSVTAVVGIQPASKSLAKTNRLYMAIMDIDGGTRTFSRSSATDNFPDFKVRCEVFNVVAPAAKRTYDAAIALYQNGQLVKILDQAEGAEIDNSRGIAYTTGKISIGKDLSNGTYELRTLCRETGQTDWTGVMMGYDKYIQLVVNGNSMVATAFGPYQYDDPSFKVNSVKVGNILREGLPITITLNVTDQNILHSQPVFLWGDEDTPGEYQLLTGCGTGLDAGETGDVVIEFTPSRSGTYHFAVCASSEEFTEAGALSTFTVEVAEQSTADIILTVGITGDNAEKQRDQSSKVPGTTLSGTLSIKNHASEDYQNYIVIYLMRNTSGNSFQSVDYQLSLVDIASKATVTLPFEFENLDVDVLYAIYVMGLERGETTPISLSEDGYIMPEYVFVMTGGTNGIQSVELDNPDADVYDLRGVRVGKASELPAMPRGLYIINKKKVLNK